MRNMYRISFLFSLLRRISRRPPTAPRPSHRPYRPRRALGMRERSLRVPIRMAAGHRTAFSSSACGIGGGLDVCSTAASNPSRTNAVDAYPLRRIIDRGTFCSTRPPPLSRRCTQPVRQSRRGPLRSNVHDRSLPVSFMLSKLALHTQEYSIQIDIHKRFPPDKIRIEHASFPKRFPRSWPPYPAVPIPDLSNARLTLSSEDTSASYALAKPSSFPACKTLSYRGLQARGALPRGQTAARPPADPERHL